jgi:hypothetical protein
MENHEKCAHECQCDCHNEGSRMVHMMACCQKCLICNKNIEKGHMEEHLSAAHPNFIIEEGLMKGLNSNDEWSEAFFAAKLTYVEIILSAEDSQKSPIKFINDFIKECDSKNTEEYMGCVSLKEVYDELSVLLTVECKKASKKLEIIFNKDGNVLAAAM